MPEWPSPLVRLTADGRAQVDGDDVPVPEGLDAEAARRWAALEGARRYAALGTALRVVVIDPGGRRWTTVVERDATIRASTAAPGKTAAGSAGKDVPGGRLHRPLLVGAAGVVLLAGVVYLLPVPTAPAQASGNGAAATATPDSPRPPRPATPVPAPSVPSGYELRDAASFRLAVPHGWVGQPPNTRQQVHFTGDGLTLTIVPGRDTTARYGTDPVAYQSHEPELNAFRAAEWSRASNRRTVSVGTGPAVAEGLFRWKENRRLMLACNRTFAIAGRYHVVLVTGPEARQTDVLQHCQQAVDSYELKAAR